MEFINAITHKLTSLDIAEILVLIACLIVSIVGHEIAHGWVAYKFGDSTAKNLNRLSPNPLRHIDIFGTIIVPAAMYLAGGVVLGWAKPVPVRMQTVFNNGKYVGAIAVALAGIAYNLALAAAAFIAIKALIYSGSLSDSQSSQTLINSLFMLLKLNILLALFNLYPLPQLDGYKALAYVLDWAGASALTAKMMELERYGFIILIIIVMSPFSSSIFSPIYATIRYVSGLI
ncbi:site-2 protease family protein [Campylobacter sp. 19-13652]|uniref:site-2 protease family protein n=1 Tax=Campylobacter sp. 19-13652 TaxID=2840180 RepID=UPI001C78EF7D|nr:site-2 protease family protein [Campylobacter sp. 19-13652]BCX79104.1 peptidase M50 [Campylobacter sp. 19-13652]